MRGIFVLRAAGPDRESCRPARHQADVPAVRAFRIAAAGERGHALLKRSNAGQAIALDRLAQPLHRGFDILRLEMAPALDRGLVATLREALEIFRGQLLSGRALPSEFLADERVLGHRAGSAVGVELRT